MRSSCEILTFSGRSSSFLHLQAFVMLIPLHVGVLELLCARRAPSCAREHLSMSAIIYEGTYYNNIT